MKTTKWLTMFNLDHWQEIIHSIRKNKLRTGITAFCVAWGIFILIILMGFGTGFQNGLVNQFKDDAENGIFIRSGTTSMAYKGMQPGRDIKFTNEDFQLIKDKVEGIEYFTGRYYLSGDRLVRYKDRYSSFSIRSVHPDHLYLEKTIMLKGRYLNDKDIKEKRKVAAIGTKVVKVLFGDNINPINRYIDINGIKYKIVGIYDDAGQPNETKIIYIPMSTAQVAYGGGNRIHQLMLTTGDAPLSKSLAIQEEVHKLLSQQHVFSLEDKRAVRIFNLLEEFVKWNKVFGGIKFFLVIIGSFTLIAGVVGVSNIMLIVVKERTREVGLRKAIGATPRSIIGLFLSEAMLITVISGYLGLIAGVAFLDSGMLTNMMLSFGFPEDFFLNPSVNMNSAIAATIILIFCGLIAGFFPARKASKIEPIVALRDE